MTYNYPSAPEIHVGVHSDVSSHYFNCMTKAKEMVERREGTSVLFVTGRCLVTAADFCSLQNRMWLTDGIIEAFAGSILRKSVSAADSRSLLLSSQAIVPVTCEDQAVKRSLRRWLDGIWLHQIDMILFSVHSQSHWQLFVAYTEASQFISVDRYSSMASKKRSRGRSGLISVIQETLDILCANYREKYKGDIVWAYSTRNTDVRDLNLPPQPSKNALDCGVLVCMYIWSFNLNRE